MFRIDWLMYAAAFGLVVWLISSLPSSEESMESCLKANNDYSVATCAILTTE